MKENVLDVLIYLFENYMLEEPEREPDQEALAQELSQVGFDHVTIDRAFDWLEHLAMMCDEQPRASADANSAMRHYSPGETSRLGLEGRGLMLSLEQCGVLDPRSREMVIDRVMALEVGEIDLENLKWVILMVLSNCAGEAGIAEWTEDLVMDGLGACVH